MLNNHTIFEEYAFLPNLKICAIRPMRFKNGILALLLMLLYPFVLKNLPLNHSPTRKFPRFQLIVNNYTKSTPHRPSSISQILPDAYSIF